MLGTMRMTVGNGSKTIDEPLSQTVNDGKTVSRRFASTLKKRISYGVIHSLKRSGLTDLSSSQKQSYEKAYRKGYMYAWNAGANKKTGDDRLSTPTRTIAEIGWQDGAKQGSADVIMTRGLI